MTEVKLFGHVARDDQSEDHSRALQPSTHLVTGDSLQDALVRPGYQLSVTILNISTVIYIQLIARSSCIAEDRGNSYAHTVGALSNDDDTEDCYVILKSRNWGIRPLF